MHPVERCGGVAQFADAVVERPLAAPDAAKVEAQRGKPARDEAFVHRLGDAVVHRAAALGVGVEDQGDWRAGAGRGAEPAFDAAFGAGKDHVGHGNPILFARFRHGMVAVAGTGPI